MRRCEGTYLELDEIFGLGECSCDLPEETAGLPPARLGGSCERIRLEIRTTIRQYDDSVCLRHTEGV